MSYSVLCTPEYGFRIMGYEIRNMDVVFRIPDFVIIREYRIQNTDSVFQNMEYGVRNMDFAFRIPYSGIWNTEYGIRTMEYGMQIPYSEIRNSEIAYSVCWITEYGIRNMGYEKSISNAWDPWEQSAESQAGGP